MRHVRRAAAWFLLVASAAVAGPATGIVLEAPTVDAGCAYLLDECRRGRAAYRAHRGYVEHPSGVVTGTTSRQADLHIGNAVEAAATMRLKYDDPPRCIAECDALLSR